MSLEIDAQRPRASQLSVGAHRIMSLLSTLNHAAFRGWILDNSLL